MFQLYVCQFNGKWTASCKSELTSGCFCSLLLSGAVEISWHLPSVRPFVVIRTHVNYMLLLFFLAAFGFCILHHPRPHHPTDLPTFSPPSSYTSPAITINTLSLQSTANLFLGGINAKFECLLISTFVPFFEIGLKQNHAAAAKATASSRSNSCSNCSVCRR